ncbi:32768_t:CDS:1, partial [Racocetra persica]
MEPINSSKKNLIDLSPSSEKPSEKLSEKLSEKSFEMSFNINKPSEKSSERSSEKPSRPVATRINTGDRSIPKIIEPTDDNHVNFEIIEQKQTNQDNTNQDKTNQDNNNQDNNNQDRSINMLASQVEEFFATSPTDSIGILVRDIKSDEADGVL